MHIPIRDMDIMIERELSNHIIIEIQKKISSSVRGHACVIVIVM